MGFNFFFLVIPGRPEQTEFVEERLMNSFSCSEAKAGIHIIFLFRPLLRS